MRARIEQMFTRVRERVRPAVLKNRGHCPICDRAVTFSARHEWLRDYYVCSHCGSIPRERALMAALEMHYPNWRELTIHESSPGNRGVSPRLVRECASYIPSQYMPDGEPGSEMDGFRCENLEALTFPDAAVDLHVTQDVLEHVFDPMQVFREIARTLRPGGAHIFTVPLVRKDQPTLQRVRRERDGTITHLAPPEYHCNPVAAEGSLVTFDWGYDIGARIFETCGLYTQWLYIDDLHRGIRAEYIDVLITRKPGETAHA